MADTVGNKDLSTKWGNTGPSSNHTWVLISVNSLKSKATADAFPAKKVKKPKRAKANYYPSIPISQSPKSLDWF